MKGYNMDNEITDKSIEPLIACGSNLFRIADALEEILRLVKKDQEDSAARQRQWDAEKK